ncbi:15325_t:CDS:2 [Funneliformis mosseae]|uniref:15325_t:CDS:1 n=1 Tax=Funneliformis mosseae TaxID=27381 RepID=A0A9N8ZJM5_FUNMO|nr:15325_t:CDS:2 [Funneliformis mosseae]
MADECILAPFLLQVITRHYLYARVVIDSTAQKISSNSPIISSSPVATVNNGNELDETQNSSSPSSLPSTPTPQSRPLSDIDDDSVDPSTITIANNALVDNARSAASISNLINHDEEQRINTNSPKSHPTSQMSSRSISPKRKGVHDNDEYDINNNGDFDPSKRLRCNLKNLSLAEGNSCEIIKVNNFNNNDSTPPSPKPYIPRPPNSFILYRQHHHPLILNKHPGINNSEISRIIADHWRNLSNQEKGEWKKKAEEAKERHMKAWPDYKYQPRRRVVGPTFKKPLKGPGAPSSVKSDAFSAQEGMMDNFVIELSKLPSHRKIDHNENLKHPSVIIIEGGSKELNKLDRNGNNNPRKPSPTEAIKAKLGLPTQQLSTSTSSTQRLPPPHTLVSPQLQSITALQSNQLYEFLKNEGIKARLCKFPDTSTPSGNALKIYQSTNRQPNPKTLHLLVAAHWWELMPVMKDQLMNGITLIVDRYVYSAMAASAAKGLDLSWCKTSYIQLLSPDLIFFLKVETSEMDNQQLPQLSLPRVNDVLGIDSDNARIAKEWQRRMQESLSRLAEVQWKILDARKSNNIINAQIITASFEVIERCRKSNTGYGNMFNNTIMSQQNQQLLPPPIVPASSQQPQYSSVNLNGSPSLSHQQQKNSNVLPPIGRHDGFSRKVHIQL